MRTLDGGWYRFLVNDGVAAYYNALMWYKTGDAPHAENAIEVFTVWSDLSLIAAPQGFIRVKMSEINRKNP